MNAYSLGDYQNHIVVAETMEGAAMAYRKEYHKEPEKLEMISKYVIIAKKEKI